MTFTSGYQRRTDPYLYAIAAIVSAAALVLYLQHRAIGELRSQTGLVLREMAQQTAQAVVADVRQTLDGPVFETLPAVNHPQIRDSRLDLLAPGFRKGLESYPHVERFFVWTEQTDTVVPGEVLFYGPGHDSPPATVPPGIPGDFTRDAQLGSTVYALAKRTAPSQQIYGAYERVGPGGEHDVFLRLFWLDARRDRFFAVIGFVIDRTHLRESFIAQLYRRHLEEVLKVRGESVPMQLRVIDEHGKVVWGAPDEPPLAARAALPMQFYPPQVRGARLAVGPDPVTWTIEVSPAHANDLLGAAAHGYWLPFLSALLMLVALTFTIQAGRRAAVVARMQADFVSHVSHQLKTPISLLSAATETVELERVRSPEKLAQYLGIIRGEVGRLSSLVQRILEFSTVQERRSLELDTVDLAALVRETVDAFRHSLSGQNFTFHVIQHGPSPSVLADPAALEQVLANLLDNAVKYSDSIREVTIRVGSAGTFATVDVTDAGIGIAPADRPRIFERFYHGSGEAGKRKGFGLGLAIARELMVAHRGRLELHNSTPQGGSTFRMSLPALFHPSVTASHPAVEAAT
ncbi:MAG: sensor histidine kinase [Vicinamibacterales bacterium]